MASNLATGRFRSGAPIAEVTNNTDWSTTTAPAAAFYDNDPANLASRGILYNHAAALSPEGICPAGMRLPSIDDMRQLSRFIDPKTERAEAPLLSATVEWAIGSDAFGFNARPSGRRNAGGSFEGLDVMDYRWLIWSSDNDPADASMGRSYTIIDGFDDDLVAASEDKRSGLSIRCLSD